LAMGMKQMLQEGNDLFIASDPDADRVGVVVRHGNEAIALTGNQVAAIAVSALSDRLGDLSKVAFVKSIVTTDLVRAIIDDKGGLLADVLPGFKYVAEKIRQWEQEIDGPQFVFGCEESYGYLLGSFVRDKDAVISSCLIAEIALRAKLQGKTLVDILNELYSRYGYFSEQGFSLKFEESKEGKEKQKALMEKLRANPPQAFNGEKVVSMADVKKQQVVDLKTQERRTIDLPVSDVLIFTLEDSSKIVIRPSGTEPKIKIYLLMKEKSSTSLQEAKENVKKKVALLETAVRNLVK
ncbi:MAG TPA: phospho-sugar mutase, partial [Chlamydiales bacterium]|nr:phospho-sugar mutase [Chlamydiales bacterium]